MKVTREAVTEKQIKAIVPHAGWDDGRDGFLYARFDVLLGDDGHRAEVTWDDDGDDRADDDGSVVYSDPELLLEVCRMDRGDWVRVAHLVRKITHEEAVRIVQADPQDLRTSHAGDWARLVADAKEAEINRGRR